MARPSYRALAALVTATSMVATLAQAPASANGGPTLRLVRAQAEVTIYRRGPWPVPLDIGVYAAAVNGDFELQAARQDYDHPIVVTQWDGGVPIQTLPDGTADGWNGLANFFDVTVTNSNDVVRLNATQTFCPAMYGRQRIDDSGPDRSRFPYYGCGGNPLALGNVWGIDQGWSLNAFDPYGYYYGYYGEAPVTYFMGKDGHFTVDVAIGSEYRSLFGISETDGTVQVGVTIVTDRRCHWPCYGRGGRLAGAAKSSNSLEPAGQSPTMGVPVTTSPDPASLPDLQVLPPWNIGISFRRNGSQYLTFSANVWNEGPSPLMVEGYRQPDTDVMDAYQYFYENEAVVGRAPVGTMEYDERDGHTHWHFQDFAGYSLLDSTGTLVVRSTKEAFCLVPTDAIDLTQPGANWLPSSIGLGTACGGESAIWVRETLDAGWGDTYTQWVPGQSFDITDLPNGRYFVRVEANPNGNLYERDSTNNIVDRKVSIRGEGIGRHVVVHPWHGIDTEYCYYCY